MALIDFSPGTEQPNCYAGSEKKTCIHFEGAQYMLKFPDPVRAKSNELRYMYNQISEHIGCQIFRACGFTVQETSLGLFPVGGVKKIVVACKDFTQSGATLYEISKLGRALPAWRQFSTSIEDVDSIIGESPFITDKDAIRAAFWDMFVVDTLIANPDRHLDNWGLIERDGALHFAPVYDCGSALAALMSDEKMQVLLDDATAFKSVEYNTTSCYSLSKKRIFYPEIYKNPPDALHEAILRTVPRIDMDAVRDIVRSTEGVSEARQRYLIAALELRYTQILAPAHKRCLEREATIER